MEHVDYSDFYKRFIVNFYCLLKNIEQDDAIEVLVTYSFFLNDCHNIFWISIDVSSIKIVWKLFALIREKTNCLLDILKEISMITSFSELPFY